MSAGVARQRSAPRTGRAATAAQYMHYVDNIMAQIAPCAQEPKEMSHLDCPVPKSLHHLMPVPWAPKSWLTLRDTVCPKLDAKFLQWSIDIGQSKIGISVTAHYGFGRPSNILMNEQINAMQRPPIDHRYLQSVFRLPDHDSDRYPTWFDNPENSLEQVARRDAEMRQACYERLCLGRMILLAEKYPTHYTISHQDAATDMYQDVRAVLDASPGSDWQTKLRRVAASAFFGIEGDPYFPVTGSRVNQEGDSLHVEMLGATPSLAHLSDSTGNVAAALALTRRRNETLPVEPDNVDDGGAKLTPTMRQSVISTFFETLATYLQLKFGRIHRTLVEIQSSHLSQGNSNTQFTTSTAILRVIKTEIVTISGSRKMNLHQCKDVQELARVKALDKDTSLLGPSKLLVRTKKTVEPYNISEWVPNSVQAYLDSRRLTTMADSASPPLETQFGDDLAEDPVPVDSAHKSGTRKRAAPVNVEALLAEQDNADAPKIPKKRAVPAQVTKSSGSDSDGVRITKVITRPYSMLSCKDLASTIVYKPPKPILMTGIQQTGKPRLIIASSPDQSDSEVVSPAAIVVASKPEVVTLDATAVEAKDSDTARAPSASSNACLADDSDDNLSA